MHKGDWEKKKRELQELQRSKKLKRTRVNGQGKMRTEYEPWPATGDVLQRIANAMPREMRKGELVQIATPLGIMRKLNGGDKITTRFNAVYSLVPMSEQ